MKWCFSQLKKIKQKNIRKKRKEKNISVLSEITKSLRKDNDDPTKHR